MGWERVPLNFQDFFDNWLPLQDKHYKLKLFVLANMVWVLWNVRNKMSMEGVFPNDLADTLFKINASLQKWRVRLVHEDGEQLKTWTLQANEWMEAFLEERRRRPPEFQFM
jgi:hypothetical protein